MQSTIIKPDQIKIMKDSEKYFLKICGFDQSQTVDDEQKEEAFSLREQYMDQLQLKIIVSFNEERMLCTYGMCIDEIQGIDKLDMLEQFYLDTWMTAILDAGRDWLKGYLSSEICEKSETPLFISDGFGPGFYGIGMEVLEDILTETEADKIGIELFHGGLKPPKSNVGYYVISKEEGKFPSRDCKHCLADHKNCLFCKNYKQV